MLSFGPRHRSNYNDNLQPNCTAAAVDDKRDCGLYTRSTPEMALVKTGNRKAYKRWDFSRVYIIIIIIAVRWKSYNEQYT